MPVGKQLSDSNPDGTSLGQSTSDLISLYSLTPIVQPSASGQAAVSTAAIASVTTTAATLTAYGFTTAQAAAIVSAINSLVTQVNASAVLQDAMRTAMVNLGVMKGSA